MIAEETTPKCWRHPSSNHQSREQWLVAGSHIASGTKGVFLLVSGSSRASGANKGCTPCSEASVGNDDGSRSCSSHHLAVPAVVL